MRVSFQLHNFINTSFRFLFQWLHLSCCSILFDLKNLISSRISNKFTFIKNKKITYPALSLFFSRNFIIFISFLFSAVRCGIILAYLFLILFFSSSIYFLSLTFFPLLSLLHSLSFYLVSSPVLLLISETLMTSWLSPASPSLCLPSSLSPLLTIFSASFSPACLIRALSSPLSVS